MCFYIRRGGFTIPRMESIGFTRADGFCFCRLGGFVPPPHFYCDKCCHSVVFWSPAMLRSFHKPHRSIYFLPNGSGHRAAPFPTRPPKRTVGMRRPEDLKRTDPGHGRGSGRNVVGSFQTSRGWLLRLIHRVCSGCGFCNPLQRIVWRTVPNAKQTESATRPPGRGGAPLGPGPRGHPRRCADGAGFVCRGKLAKVTAHTIFNLFGISKVTSFHTVGVIIIDGISVFTEPENSGE